VGRKVYFWGNQWSKMNGLTLSAAPASFKGFANSAGSTAPTCGGTWKSDPGNSSGPPPTIPPYITVIATSSASQSGSVISGDNRKIIVVKVDLGYASDPGHPGTGTVVSVTCQ
jgi:hypothetical protein